MSDYLRELPFPRGSTLSCASLISLDDSTMSQLEGRLVQVEDTEHGTGEQITLRIVKNDTGGDITVSKKLAAFSTTSESDYGCRIGTFVNTTDGGVCKPIDDAYTITTIPDDDLFYVVEEGSCDIVSAAGGISSAAGEAVSSDNLGCIKDNASAAGKYVVGVLQEAAAVAATAYRVRVSAGIAPPPAAG